MSLGVKIAEKNRPVVTLIGDGTFMYNSSPQAMVLARQEGLATLTVIHNNNGYEAMRLDQRRYYPDGLAEQHDMYLGQPLAGFDYAELASHLGGFGRRVETAGELGSAIFNVMVEA